jgi:hypothetical protein
MADRVDAARVLEEEAADIMAGVVENPAAAPTTR